jgi:hypothetical protein
VKGFCQVKKYPLDYYRQLLYNLFTTQEEVFTMSIAQHTLARVDTERLQRGVEAATRKSL